MLRIDREALLQDARDRLLARLPELDTTEIDPTDPGWLLLEQCAWMVEELSIRLDQYPLAVLQELLGLMGGELLSALPSMGIVALEALDSGTLQATSSGGAAVRLFAPQTETRDQIEFVPLESAVPVRAVRTLRIWSWDGAGLGFRDGSRLSVAGGAVQAARHFDSEELSISLVGIAGDAIVEPLEEAVRQL
jgi:hypothetical protein